MDGPKAALLAAYLVAMGWVSYRDIAVDHRAPQPRTIVRGSALYGLLGILQPLMGDKLTAALGWGVLAAQIMRDLQRQKSGQPPSNSGLGALLDPNGGKAPDASTPPPGTSDSTPPYVWGLPGAPGVPDSGSRPSGPSLSYRGPGRVHFI